MMKKSIKASVLALVVLLFTAGLAVAQSGAQKVLEGKVLGNGDAPLANAIVYLQSSKDSSIRSFIATADGSYRFGQVSSELDYTVWAQYKNVKSSTKTVSSFDSRKVVNIELKVKADK